MNIQEALKETGKATLQGMNGFEFAQMDGDDLCWCRVSNEAMGIMCAVSFKDITSNDWQPYHEVKEIRPEKAGELWKQERGFTAFTFDGMGGLKIINDNGAQEYVSECDKMIHGKNGWKRVDPLVLTEEEIKAEIRRMLNPEDDSIERIEIEANLVDTIKGFSVYSFTLPEGYAVRVEKGKMILEIPKEPHECQG